VKIKSIPDWYWRFPDDLDYLELTAFEPSAEFSEVNIVGGRIQGIHGCRDRIRIVIVQGITQIDQRSKQTGIGQLISGNIIAYRYSRPPGW
jgi:hypothetical protein